MTKRQEREKVGLKGKRLIQVHLWPLSLPGFSVVRVLFRRICYSH